jgi:hypothetical protein
MRRHIFAVPARGVKPGRAELLTGNPYGGTRNGSDAMDVLSDVLRTIRLQGTLFLHAEFQGPDRAFKREYGVAPGQWRRAGDAAKAAAPALS